MLGKQVRIFTTEDEINVYAGIGDATLVHVCDSHVVVEVDCGVGTFQAIHTWGRIETIDTLMPDEEE